LLKADVRVIAASNVDLEHAVKTGTFRRDLFYRLSVFPIRLPPLRERPEDIHPLVIHFLEHYKQKTGRFISGISKDALYALIEYDWPGNVRELENAGSNRQARDGRARCTSPRAGGGSERRARDPA
ncbi:MAG: sigma 54-interacting transcriptional regulator, partial [Acidobacteriota bacterium]|nr:sigma 54-interacting transcriptional regulator [Acidobacteriota bacterium]